MENGVKISNDVLGTLLTQLRISGDQPLARVIDAVEENYPDNHQAVATVLYLFQSGNIDISKTPPTVSLTEIGSALAIAIESRYSKTENWFIQPQRSTTLLKIRDFLP